MVGAQRLAMTFMERATLDGQTVPGADASVLRATQLMRIFNEQIEMMARLKGKAVNSAWWSSASPSPREGKPSWAQCTRGRGTSGTDR
jgi:hypothetical protein